MNSVAATEPQAQVWEQVSEGITRTFLRSEPGEKRVLIKIPHNAIFAVKFKKPETKLDIG